MHNGLVLSHLHLLHLRQGSGKEEGRGQRLRLTLMWIALQIWDQTPRMLPLKGNWFNNSLLSGGKKSSLGLHLREGGSLSGGTPLPQPPFLTACPLSPLPHYYFQ